MMRFVSIAPALFIGLLLLEPLSAAELELGLEGTVQYDTNVLGRSDEERADWLWRLGPRIHAYDQEGELRWRLRYSPDYNDYFHLNEFDGWDQDARGELEWQVGPRTSVWARNQYQDVSQLTTLLDDPAGSPADVPLELGLVREGLERNIFEIGAGHRLGLRSQLDASVRNVASDFESPLRNDTNVLYASLSYLYSYTPADRLGLIVSGTRQELDPPVGPSIDSTFVNTSLQWQHEFSPTFYFLASAGPTWVDRESQETNIVVEDTALFPVQRNSEGFLAPVETSSCPELDDGTHFLADGCEAFPSGTFSNFDFLLETGDLTIVGDIPDDVTSSLTYFANLEVVKEWARFEARLGYTRSAATTGGTSGQVIDLVTGTLLWRPAERWRLRLTANWESREQATESLQFRRALEGVTVQGVNDVARNTGFRAIPVDNRFENVRYTAGAHLTYRLNRETSLFLRVFWSQQRVDDPLGQREQDRTRVTLGFVYTFRPIGLPI
jgi:hypothetical protein